MKQKYTIVNLDFLGKTKLPRIDPKEIIANDNICLRFTDQELYERAVNDPDLMQHIIIGPSVRSVPPKPEPPPKRIIREGPFISFEFVNKIIKRIKEILS